MIIIEIGLFLVLAFVIIILCMFIYSYIQNIKSFKSIKNAIINNTSKHLEEILDEVFKEPLNTNLTKKEETKLHKDIIKDLKKELNKKKGKDI